MRLLGLAWAGGSGQALQSARQDVLAKQRADGGWAQLDSLESDAYATGQSLYALHESGFGAASADYRRGVNWLLRTQEPDGSWHVTTRAFPFQTLLDTGYGHGRDQWISAQATGWALMALMAAEERGSEVARSALP